MIRLRYVTHPLSAFVAKCMDINKPVNFPMLMRYSALLLRAEWKGREIGAADLKRALSVRPTFAGDEFDDAAAEDMVKVASPTGKVTAAEFGELEAQLKKRKAVVEALSCGTRTEITR